MNNPTEAILVNNRYGLSQRSLVVSVLVVFCVVTFLGFTLYIELKPKPAEAFFGIDAAAIIAFFKTHELLTKILKATALMIVVQFSLRMLQRLEQNHTIRNLLYYSDALEFDQYVGNGLNKLFIRNQEQKVDAPEASNLGDIIGELETVPVVGIPPTQVEDVAKKSPEQGGLTEEQQIQLMRGGLALMTSQVQCGGVNQQAIRNIALYNATRAIGFDKDQINPRQGANFYQQLAHLGNPFTNSAFQELAMRDAAATVEAEARRAAELEIVGQGTKSLRGIGTTGISRTSSAVVGFIQGQADNAIEAAISQADSAVSAALVKGALQLIQGVILAVGSGRIIGERGFCGTGRAAAGTYRGPVNIPGGQDAFITANGVAGTIRIEPGDSALLTWSTGDRTGQAAISGIGPVANLGTLKVTPPETTTYELTTVNEECRGFESEGTCTRTLSGQMREMQLITLEHLLVAIPGDNEGLTDIRDAIDDADDIIRLQQRVIDAIDELKELRRDLQPPPLPALRERTLALIALISRVINNLEFMDDLITTGLEEDGDNLRKTWVAQDIEELAGHLVTDIIILQSELSEMAAAIDAEGGFGPVLGERVVLASVTVLVGEDLRDQVIFEAVPSLVSPGESVTLSWDLSGLGVSEDDVAVTLSGGRFGSGQDVVGLRGSISDIPSGTTSYSLTIIGLGINITETASVTVEGGVGGGPDDGGGDTGGDGDDDGGVANQCQSPYFSENRSTRKYDSNILIAFDEVYSANPQLAGDTSNSSAVGEQILSLVVDNLAAKGFEVGTSINCNGVPHPEQEIIIGQRPGDDLGENYDVFQNIGSGPDGRTFEDRTQTLYIDHASWNRCVGGACGN